MSNFIKNHCWTSTLVFKVYKLDPKQFVAVKHCTVVISVTITASSGLFFSPWKRE